MHRELEGYALESNHQSLDNVGHAEGSLLTIGFSSEHPMVLFLTHILSGTNPFWPALPEVPAFA
jgi:hypothetical protein